MIDNGLDAGLYRIKYDEKTFVNTNLFKNRYSLSGYTSAIKTERKMCFHDGGEITFNKFNTNCELFYYNSFIINEHLVLGNSGGLAYKEDKLTGVISGYDDETKLGKVACGDEPNPNCTQSEESIKSILNKYNVALT